VRARVSRSYVLNDFPLTGCHETGDKAAPYACPGGPEARNPGYVSGRAGEVAAAKGDHSNCACCFVVPTGQTDNARRAPPFSHSTFSHPQ
jgi:hypothetical protein